MTMREMQIFLEVARTLNMSTAGKSLYLSQSTVSQSILNIERRYNVQLFRRQSKHLILTKQGKSFRIIVTRFSNYIEGWNMIYSTPAKSHCVLEQI